MTPLLKFGAGIRIETRFPIDLPKVKADAPNGQWNRFFITLKGDRLTVVLNGKTVIENEQLPGIPPRGPIGLQHHGDPVRFAQEMSTGYL